MTLFSQIVPGLLLNDNLSEAQLIGSPMCINGMALLKYASNNGGIQLTKSGCFYRKCVVWAAEAFRWPDYEPEKLYRLNRVLDEQDFPPLSAMHELMILGLLIRHADGWAVLTKPGKEMLGNFGGLQAQLFETFFGRFDFSAYERFSRHNAHTDYQHFLGVLRSRLDVWTPFEEFAQWCLPITILPTSSSISPLFDACLFLMSRLVRPLKWLGLMEEEPTGRSTPIEQRRIRRTVLFDQFLLFGVAKPHGLSVH